MISEEFKNFWEKILNRSEEERTIILYGVMVVVAILAGLLYARLFQSRLANFKAGEAGSFINWDNAGYQQARPMLEKTRTNAVRIQEGIDNVSDVNANVQRLDNATDTTTTLEILKELKKEVGEDYFETSSETTTSQPVKNN